MGRYNPEIDGLRAIAVLSVILFHFDVSLFSGGFVGVDVFFVISGFLITRLILEELTAGRFSFKRFYLRRARRLFPAMFTALAATFIGSVLLLSPEDLEKLSGSLIYALLSVSNMFFWQQAGYFDTEAVMKPLLHTWSLSVEEQFYLIWPALLVIGSRLPRHLVLGLIVILGLISLGLSELALTHWPSTAFYWMPLRIFEFSIGALLYWLQTYRRPDRLASEALAVVGLGLIGYSVFIFSEASRFPGVLALVPCIGTAFLIQAGPTRLVGRLLCARPIVALGLLSYSLYLVHWPLVVFLKYSQGASLSVLQQALLIAGSFALAILLYLGVEKPLRYGRQDSSKQANLGFALCCSLAALMLALPAADAWGNRGWPWRFPKAEIFLTSYDINNKDYVWALWRKLEAKQNKQSRVYLIGDSQAADMLNAIQLSSALDGIGFPPRVRHVQYFCGAVVVSAQELDAFYERENTSFQKAKSQRSVCEKQREAAFTGEALSSSDLIILSPYWQPYLVKRLPQTLEYIRSKTKAQIIVVGQKHMLASSTAIYNKHESFNGIEAAAAGFIDPETVKMNAQIEKIAANQGVFFFNPLNALCDANRTCQVVGNMGGPITFDTHHLTPEGADLMGRYFKVWLAESGFKAASTRPSVEY